VAERTGTDEVACTVGQVRHRARIRRRLSRA
jgi:hypothetical protein